MKFNVVYIVLLTATAVCAQRKPPKQPKAPKDPLPSAPRPPPSPSPPTNSDGGGTPVVSKKDVADLEAAITQSFGLEAAYGQGCTPCTSGDAIGELVRLTNHDAMGEGGPNGCLDFTELDHSGLQTTVNTLRAAWDPFSESGISFADCIVMAGELAIRFASTVGGPQQTETFMPEAISGPLILPTRFGRRDTATCSDEGHMLHADTSWNTLSTTFASKFGMNAEDCVAIMGAHTLGRAEKQNLGFEGGWTKFQSSFSNLFYVMMVARDWRQDCMRSPNAAPTADCVEDQWLEPFPRIALTVDVELVISPSAGCFHFGAANPLANGPQARADYSPNSCPHNAATIATFQSFAGAGGTARWWAAFSTAWKKMTENNVPGLVEAV